MISMWISWIMHVDIFLFDSSQEQETLVFHYMDCTLESGHQQMIKLQVNEICKSWGGCVTIWVTLPETAWKDISNLKRREEGLRWVLREQTLSGCSADKVSSGQWAKPAYASIGHVSLNDWSAAGMGIWSKIIVTEVKKFDTLRE